MIIFCYLKPPSAPYPGCGVGAAGSHHLVPDNVVSLLQAGVCPAKGEGGHGARGLSVPAAHCVTARLLCSCDLIVIVPLFSQDSVTSFLNIYKLSKHQSICLEITQHF